MKKKKLSIMKIIQTILYISYCILNNSLKKSCKCLKFVPKNHPIFTTYEKKMVLTENLGNGIFYIGITD